MGKQLYRIGQATMLAILLGLVGCTTAPVQVVDSAPLLRDPIFKPPSRPIPTAAEILAPSAEMKDYIQNNSEFRMLSRRIGEREALVEAFYSRRMLQIDYESSYTRTAAEAFSAKSGNCLALVLMTASFARELGLAVHYQIVQTSEFWFRDSGLNLLAGHVNLSLGAPMRVTNHIALIEPDLLQIDFIGPVTASSMRRIEIDETMIIAMFYNNRAVEHLQDGQVDDAYWWASAAIHLQPRYLAAFNTLAVIYRRHGNSAQAEAALRAVLDREPGNVQALSNLALVLNDQNRQDEARVVKARLAELQPYPPFRFFDMGVEAMARGDYAKARDLFQREIARSAYYHEFYYWLALADFALGDVRDARKNLTLAAENSLTRKDHDRYAAKLNWIEQSQRSGTTVSPSFLPQPTSPTGRTF